jgi:hypothetical protein
MDLVIISEKGIIRLDFSIDYSLFSIVAFCTFAVCRYGYWIAAPHLSFPSIGHLKRVGKAYQWLPVNYTTIFTAK